MSSTFSVRLPREMLERMRERRDVNWAEIIREAIRKTLNEPVLPITIDNLISSLRDAGKWEILFCLYLKAELLNPSYVLRNLEVRYPKRAAEIIHQSNSILKKNGIDPNLSGSLQGRYLRDLIKDGLLVYGVYDKFESDVREELRKESLEINKAAWLLAQYFIRDLYEEYEYSLWIVPHGFIRTLNVMLGMEDVSDIVKELEKIGLILWDHYESKAYSHEMIRGCDYARPIFKDLSNDKSYLHYTNDLLKDKNFLSFLRWVSADHGFDFRAVEEYREEEAKKEFVGSKPFDEILENLIRKGLVLIDYWPHRRRAGKRSSMPPHWVYRLTPIAKREILPQILTQNLLKAC